MIKKVLLPLILLLALVAALVGAAFLYEKHYGSEGPFENQHHH